MLPFKKNKLVSGSIIALSTALIINFAIYMELFDEVEFKALDFRTGAFSKTRQPSDDISVILIDEASLRSMNPVVGRWPWPRSLHADLINFLALGGARAVFFDILFTENERVPGQHSGFPSPNDSVLVEATGNAANIYSAAQLLVDEEDEYNKGLLGKPLPEEFVKRFSVKLPLPPSFGKEGGMPRPNNNYYIPFPELYRASKGVGIVEFSSDRDGIYRRTKLFREYQGAYFPVLSMTAVIERLKPESMVVKENKLLLLLPKAPGFKSDISIPLQPGGSYLINMYSDFKPYSMGGVLASFQKIKQGELEGLPVNPDDFKDKIVFVGGSAAGVEDLKFTSLGGNVPGVYLHASLYSNVLKNDFLRTVPRIVTYLSVLVLSVAVVFVILWTRSIVYQIAIPTFIAAIYVLPVFWVFKLNVVFDMVAPVASIVFSWMTAFAYLSFTEGKDKKKIKRMLGQYVSPAILTSVLDKGSKDVLTAEVGSRERLTILFSDIRGFTSISEALEAEKVVEVLNGYLSGMVDVIFKHEGTLDKFIGDAIMAFWGAPVRVNDHGKRAVTSAIEMIRQLELFNESVKARGLQPLAIGVGINTGEVILGNIGSEKKLDYTVIGDNVNLASRMEGLTKEYGCPILITESTYEEVRGEIPCRVVDMVRVKGKKKGIKIFEPIAVLPLSVTGDSGDNLMEVSEKAFDLYLARKWREAREAYLRIGEMLPGDKVSKMFILRCEDYMVEEPTDDWDGVYTMTRK